MKNYLAKATPDGSFFFKKLVMVFSNEDPLEKARKELEKEGLKLWSVEPWDGKTF